MPHNQENPQENNQDDSRRGNTDIFGVEHDSKKRKTWIGVPDQIIWRAFSTVCFLLILGKPLLPTKSDASTKSISALSQDVSALKDTVDAQSKQIDGLTKEVHSMQLQMAAVTQQLLDERDRRT